MSTTKSTIGKDGKPIQWIGTHSTWEECRNAIETKATAFDCLDVALPVSNPRHRSKPPAEFDVPNKSTANFMFNPVGSTAAKSAGASTRSTTASKYADAVDPDNLDFSDPILDKADKPITADVAALQLAHWMVTSGRAAAKDAYELRVKLYRESTTDFLVIVANHLSADALKLVSAEFEMRDPTVLWAALRTVGEPDRATSKINAINDIQNISFDQGTLLSLKSRIEDAQRKLEGTGEARASDTTIIANLEQAVKRTHKHFRTGIMVIKTSANSSANPLSLADWWKQLMIIEEELERNAGPGKDWRRGPSGGAPSTKSKSVRPAWANAATAEDDMSEGEDRRDRSRRSEDVCSSCKGPHHIRECNSSKTITCPEAGCSFKRNKNTNTCDNYRCDLNPKNAGRKKGGGGGKRKETASLASEFKGMLKEHSKTMALMMKQELKAHSRSVDAKLMAAGAFDADGESESENSEDEG